MNQITYMGSAALWTPIGNYENAISLEIFLNGLTLEAPESSTSLLRFTKIFTLLYLLKGKNLPLIFPSIYMTFS